MADRFNNPVERWLPVVGFERLYEVSSLGRVRSLDRVIWKTNQFKNKPFKLLLKGKVLHPSAQQRGHSIVRLNQPSGSVQRYVHRLVLEAFACPCPEGMECRHLNGKPVDNRLVNLRWGTRLENFADRTRLGEHNGPRGIRNPNAILNESTVRQIRRDAAAGKLQKDIARLLGVSASTVSMVVSGTNWGWLK